MGEGLKRAIAEAKATQRKKLVEGSCGCIFCDIDLPRLTTVVDIWVHRTAQGIMPCTRT